LPFRQVFPMLIPPIQSRRFQIYPVIMPYNINIKGKNMENDALKFHLENSFYHVLT